MTRRSMVWVLTFSLMTVVLPVTASDNEIVSPHDTPAFTPPSWPEDAELNMTDWDDMSATLTWPTAIDGDTPVEVYQVSRNNVAPGLWPADGPRSAMFDHLPDTVYQYRVVAFDSNRLSSEPLILNFTTGTGIFWAFDAQGFSTPLTNTSTRMEWPAALHTDGEIVSYLVYFQDLESVIDEVDADSRSYTFDDLTVGGHYFVGIRAVDSEGAVSSQLVRPFFQVSPPYWPTGAELTATAVDSYFVHLSWPAAVDDYEAVELYSIRRDGVQIAIFSSAVTEYTDQGLSAETEYFYEVVAYDENTVASMPLSALVTTGVGPYWYSLMGLELVTRSSSTTEIYWPGARSQDAEIVLYEVAVNGSVLASVASHIQRFVVDGLVPDESYLVEVRALDENGLWSRPLSAEFTQEIADAPVWPADATLSAARGRHSVTLSWPAAIPGGGDVTNYELFYEGVGLAGFPSSVREVTVDGLEEDGEYEFAVRAMDEWDLATPFIAVKVLPFVELSVGAFDPETGQWHLRSPDGSVRSFFFGNPGDIPFVGDWDGDGIATPGLYRQSTGFAYLIHTIPAHGSSVAADLTFHFGNPGDVPIVGDWDDDGKDTLSIYRQSEGRVYIINTLPQEGGSPSADFSYHFGNPGDKPFAGDFNGDGTDTVGLHRESTGIVYFRNSHTTGAAHNEFYFGNPGDRLIAGDWGIVDGVDTPGVFRPSSQTWYFRFSNSQGFAEHSFVWGHSRWLPVAGNWGLGD